MTTDHTQVQIDLDANDIGNTVYVGKTGLGMSIFDEMHAIRDGRHAEFLAGEVMPTEFLMEPMLKARLGSVDVAELARLVKQICASGSRIKLESPSQ